jgi:type I restriction enzyme S subunit
MFGGPEPCDRTLDQIASIASGITKGRKSPLADLQSVPYLAVSNVQAGYLDLKRVKTIEASPQEIERYRLQANDILLTEGGDPDKLGRGALWRAELARCIHQNHVFRVRVRDGQEVEPVFLSSQLAGSRGRAYFLRAAKQTTGIASINKTQLSGFPVLVPSIERQREFCRRLSRAQDLVERQRLHFAHLNALFASLQNRAFAGAI